MTGGCYSSFIVVLNIPGDHKVPRQGFSTFFRLQHLLTQNFCLQHTQQKKKIDRPKKHKVLLTDLINMITLDRDKLITLTKLP